MDAPRDEDANQKSADTELEKQIRQLGGVHTYDLVVDVTHLIVGNYDTPKYRHIAKDRHDVKVMDGLWIDALTDLWTRDAPIDLPAVEAQWRLLPLETNGPAPGEEDRGRLACSISGFHDLEERQNIIDRIVENGGIYLADLDRKNVTHLIVNEPKGNKFEAARKWGMHTVSLAWLDQSIERGMILDEQYFDPILPPEEQGRNAWLKPSERNHRSGAGKRSISAVKPSALSHEQRKLRRTTSMKLGGQRDNIWGDIMANSDSSARTVFADDRIEVVDSAWDLAAKNAPPEAVFISCCFFIAGFDEWQFNIMCKVIRDLGGAILDEMDDFSMIQDGSTRRCLLFVVVPQCSRPENHPKMPGPGRLPVRKVTEFFIERCLHAKTLLDPRDHVLGRPFLKWPLDGFQGLTMGTSGFAGIDLLHVEKCVSCMGARYAPRLNETVSILLCKSLESTRKDKIKLAMENDIPIVSADWLWSCVAAATMLPVSDFLFTKLRQKPTVTPRPRVAKRPESRGGLESTAAAQPGGTAAATGTAPGATTRPESRAKRADASSVAPVAVAADATPVVPAVAVSAAAPAVPTPSIAAPAAPPTRKEQFVDRSAFANDAPQGAKAGGKLAPRNSKPEPASFPTRDTFGSGIVQKPARSISTPIPKQTAPQDPAKKPVEASKPSPTEPAKPVKPTESAEVTTAAEPAEPTISEAAPDPQDAPDEFTAGPPSPPPPNPPAASIQPSVEHHPTKPDDDDNEKHVRRRDEDQRAAERAAMASTIMASKLNSLAGAKTGEGTGDEEGSAKPTRRRRGIFGRAVSNVSAASSGSHDSVQQQQQQQQQTALGAGDEGFIRSRSDGVLLGLTRVDAPEDETDLSALPSTQLGWIDAAGAQRKAEMMQRLLAAELGPEAVLPPIPEPPPQIRLPTTTSTTTSTRVTRRSARR